MYRNFKNKKGFTLIELLVVMAIIGLLASVVLVALSSARVKSRDSKRIADMRQMLSAFNLYFNEYGTYPTTSAAGVTLNGNGPSLTPTIIQRFPTAPTPADGSCAATGLNGNEYYWLVNANGNNAIQTFTATFCLGGPTGSFLAGPHSISQAGIR